jgi:ABC-type multidrug transport system ATPase subunit
VDTIISVKNLSKSYPQVKAVDGIDLTIKRGEFLGFVGPNGAGKTSTIRMLTGIIPPDHGEILIDGFTVGERKKIARIIGVVPESRGFYDWMTAFEYLQFFSTIYGIKKSLQPESIQLLLDQVGLLDRQTDKIGTYSRGMKQRLGLARALINDPRILFLDEPTLGLDPQGQEDIQNLLTKLNRDGVTIFLSSHLLHEVSDLCSRIAIIDKGKLIIQGTINELQQKVNLKNTYYLKIKGDLKGIENQKLGNQIIEIKRYSDIIEFLYEGDIKNANTLIDELRLKHIQILEFRSKSDNLTDIFLNLTSR